MPYFKDTESPAQRLGKIMGDAFLVLLVVYMTAGLLGLIQR